MSKTIKLKKHGMCKSILSKGMGLMFSRKKTLVFEFRTERRINLHMWFVFFPIDIYFLNKNKKVIEMKKKFKPFKFYSPKKKAKYVIEIPRPNKYKIVLGDKIKF